MDNIIKLFRVSRPISWINTAFPFAAGYVMLGGSIDPLFILATLFFLIPYNVVMYGINDVFDYESDIQNPRKGSIEGAVEAKQFHPFILWSCAILSIPFIIALAFFMPLPALMTLAVVMFFVIAYSIKGLRFKEVPFLDSITSSLHFVGPLLIAAACFGFPSAAWPFITSFLLWGLASHAFGAVQDIIPDRKGGLHSIATVIGARATIWFSTLCYALSCIIVIAQGGLSTAVGIVGLSYIANVIPYLTITDKTSGVSNKGWRRFIWVNYFVGAVVTVVLILS
jgi:4-hydroxybenzoate polyprenyltransferase